MGLRAAIAEAEQSHRHQDGSAPTEVELARVTGADAEDIVEARAAVACCRPRSLDEDPAPGAALPWPGARRMPS